MYKNGCLIILLAFLIIALMPVRAEPAMPLVVGSEQNFPPFALGMHDGEADGFSVELWKAVAMRQGFTYTMRVRPFHELLQEFKDGRIDVLINLAQSDNRRLFADFSVTHVTVGGAIFVRKGEAAITREDDLAFHPFIVLKADLAHDYALQRGWEKQLTAVDTTKEGMELLASGRYDAMLISRLTGLQTLNELSLTTLEALPITVGYSQKFAFAVRKNNADLLARLNEGLALTKADGSYDVIYEKWFGIYEPKQVSIRDILTYLIPFVCLTLLVFAAQQYLRRIERKNAAILRARESGLQAAIADRERLYATLLSNLSGMAYRCRGDADWTMEYVSEGCLELTGYSRQQLIGNDNLSYGSLIYEEDAPRVAKSCEEHLRDFSRCSNEYRIRCANGSTKWVWDQAQGIYDDKKQLLHIEGFITDITHIKQTQISLERSLTLNQRLAQVIDLHVLVTITDINGKLVYVNDAFCALSQYSREELLGQDNKIVNSRYHDKAFFTELWTTVRAGHIWRGEICNRAKDGSIYWVATTILPFMDNEGTVQQFYALRTDITTQKIHAQSMEKAYTRELQAKLELQRLNRTLSVMSRFHEVLVHAQDEFILLSEVCNLLVEVGGYKLAWVGYALDDSVQTLQPIAQCGVNYNELIQLTLSWGDNENGQHAAGCAIRTEHSVVKRYSAISEGDAMLNNVIAAHQIRAKLGLPLRDSNRVFGCLSIAAQEDDAFDKSEMELLERLAADLGYGIDGLRQRASRQHAEQELEWQRNYDTVCGLINRNLFNDRLQQTLSRAARNQRIVSVFVLNIDRFKNINESLGYAAGDALLQLLARRFLSVTRPGDNVARLASDQFAVALDDIAHVEDLTPLVRHLMTSLGAEVKLNEHSVFCTFSIGISIYPKDGDNADVLIRNAEAAMRNAKSLGGNHYRYYLSEMNTKALERFGLEVDLHRAIERRELRLHYQPKVNAQTGALTGAEALIRWQHSQLGLVPPIDFISLAEESGLILELGAWVLDEACRQLRAWQQNGLMMPSVAINVSPRQFRQPDLVQLFGDVLARHQLAGHFLQIEITESMLMHDMEESIAILLQLKSLGMTLALDDFGTGFSSLSYLKRLPFDYLKIDRSFVRDLTSRGEDAAICRAMIGMAHNLHLKAIAEGVENEAQAQYLRRYYCDELQGYYFSRPLPADQFENLLQTPFALQVPSSDDSSLPCLLIVDDDVAVLNALKRLLRNESYRILVTSTPSEALELMAKRGVNVVLIDYLMPHMNGIEFLTRIRDLYPEVVSIMLTGYSDVNTVTDAINLGMIHKFVPKPWNDEQLRSELRDAFLYQRKLQQRADSI